MPIVRIEPLGAELELASNETLFDAAFRLGYEWPTNCYGQQRCSLCHVRVLAGEEYLSPAGEAESSLVSRLRRYRYRGEQGDLVLRLACRLRVSGDVVVRHEQLKPRE